ncbi:hypothetical protein Hdeb2414_s0006g00222051 [Helianthus debilis subsp. tardiflorus]
MPKMGKVSKETGALKLIRAGGIVELYKHPIKASQIMERYPRHCVTRPDFFRNPSVVVKPESVLRPGKVFFIVPYHTVYRLVKSKGARCNRHYRPDHNEAAKTPTLENIHQMENVNTSFFHQIVPVEHIKNAKQGNRRTIFKDGDYDSDETLAASASGCFSTRKKSGGLGEVSKDTSASRDGCLKPCLKKNRPDNTRFQRGPRVRFMLPDEDDDDDDEKWDTDFSEF